MNIQTPYEKFCWSVFDKSFHAHREGVDIQLLAKITPEQKTELEARLLDVLPNTNDSRPFVAAGVMKLKSAAPILKLRLSTGFKTRFNDLNVYAAHALHQIEQWPDALAVILNVFQNLPPTLRYEWTRIQVISALADFPDNKTALKTLFDAVEDKDTFVGFLAVGTLKKVFAGSSQLAPLLDRLEKTQIEPNRWVPSFLDERQELFASLQNITGITMPKVARPMIEPKTQQPEPFRILFNFLASLFRRDKNKK